MPETRLTRRCEKFYENQEEIFRLIAHDLGLKKFMDFARQKQLKIRESELENLSHRHPTDVPSRTYELLKLAHDRNTRESFPDIVLGALIKSRRLDLKNKIEADFLS